MGKSPGATATKTTVQQKFLLSDPEIAPQMAARIKSTAVDAGNSPATTLRPGLLLGQLAATTDFQQYSAVAVDGTQEPVGFLLGGVAMLDEFGVAQTQGGTLVMGGIIDPANVFGLDDEARLKLCSRFLFSDEWNGVPGPNARPISVKVGNYVVVAADRGKLFSTRGTVGAVQFTLPALAAVGPNFNVAFQNDADQSMTVIRAGADTIVAFNNLVAVSLAFSTAGNKIGARVELRPNDDKSKWVATHVGIHTLTVT
jgi:hypothetical protein